MQQAWQAWELCIAFKETCPVLYILFTARMSWIVGEALSKTKTTAVVLASRGEVLAHLLISIVLCLK